MSGEVQVEQAARYGACAISDAMNVLGLEGAPSGLRWLSGGEHPFAGRAVTVQLGPADDTPSTRHLCTAAVAAAGPASVMVIAHPGNACAGWGGLLSLAAKIRGVKGVVVDGPARDVDEARELGFPIFAREATPVTARGRIREVSWGERRGRGDAGGPGRGRCERRRGRARRPGGGGARHGGRDRRA
jgi:regulator of RNase E activity RraA